VLEGPVDTGGRAYAEWAIEEGGGGIFLGVTEVEPADLVRRSGNAPLHASRGSRMHHCEDSVYPGGGLRSSRQQRRGGQVGLLVDGGRLWVFINGALHGPGPMASDLPARVLFAVELYIWDCEESRVRVVTGKPPPPTPTTQR
jgi:hypothetical protein